MGAALTCGIQATPQWRALNVQRPLQPTPHSSIQAAHRGQAVHGAEGAEVLGICKRAAVGVAQVVLRAGVEHARARHDGCQHKPEAPECTTRLDELDEHRSAAVDEQSN